jgi:hypothetical protein
MGRVETHFDYPGAPDRPGAIPLSRWLTQRFAEGWFWAGDRPRELVIDGEPVRRFRFFRDTHHPAHGPRTALRLVHPAVPAQPAAPATDSARAGIRTAAG